MLEVFPDPHKQSSVMWRMRPSTDSKRATKGLSEESLRAAYLSSLENCHGATTPPQFPASLLGRIARFSRTPPGLAVISILWALFVFALVFASIPLTSWEMPARASNASLTAAFLLESDSDGWMARRLFCSPSRPCDALSPFSEDSPSNLRYEILYDNPAWLNQTA